MSPDLRAIRAPHPGPCYNCRELVARAATLWQYRPYGRVWVCTRCVALVILATLRAPRHEVSRNGTPEGKEGGPLPGRLWRGV